MCACTCRRKAPTDAALPGLVMGLGGPGSERAELGCRAKPGQPAGSGSPFL